MPTMRVLPGLDLPPLPARVAARLAHRLAEAGLGDTMVRRAIRTPLLLNRPFGRYTPRRGDLFVSTYLKSGTNWTLQLAVQTAWRGEARFTHIHDLVPWPDAPVPLPARLGQPRRSPDGVLVVKTHLPRNRIPFTPDGRYVVVMRDPKAVLVSAWHFVRGVIGNIIEGDVTPAEFVDAFCSHRFLAGSWAEHAASWWPHRDDDNVLLLRFRDMKAGIPGVQRQLERLMDITLDDAARAEVLRLASFAHMKQHDDAFGNVGPILRGQPPAMVRKGAVRSKEVFTADQRARVDAWCAAELARLGSDLPYRELFG